MVASVKARARISSTVSSQPSASRYLVVRLGIDLTIASSSPRPTGLYTWNRDDPLATVRCADLLSKVRVEFLHALIVRLVRHLPASGLAGFVALALGAVQPTSAALVTHAIQWETENRYLGMRRDSEGQVGIMTALHQVKRAQRRTSGGLQEPTIRVWDQVVAGSNPASSTTF